jgi:putative salt-induced outer membrane protein YdiY
VVGYSAQKSTWLLTSRRVSVKKGDSSKKERDDVRPRRISIILGTALLLATMSTGQAGAEGTTKTSPCPAAGWQAGVTAVSVAMSTGEMLSGLLTGCSDENVELDHPILGHLKIAAKDVTAVTTAAPAAEETATEAPPAPGPKWESDVEAGINGSRGNSETLKIRAATAAKRTTETGTWSGDFTYTRSEDDSRLSEHKAILNSGYDWNLSDPWLYFALGSVQYDQFQDYDALISFSTGPGYKFIDTERTSLVGRIGAGFSHKFGGAQDGTSPEAIAGYDLEHALTPLQKLTSSARIYPDLGGLGDYRAVAKAAWDIAMHEDGGLALRLGVEDRYDSNPGDAKKNDFDYFASLLWNF